MAGFTWIKITAPSGISGGNFGKLEDWGAGAGQPIRWSHRRGAESATEPEVGPHGGRPQVEVISIFIADTVTGDPGHPLSRVRKNLKYF